MSVCAVLGRPTDGLEVPTVVADRLRSGLERALETGAEWIWVLDGSAVPRAGALTSLIEGLERVDGLPAPVLLTGVVLGPNGQVDPNRAPWYRRFRIDVALSSADHALLPVRGSTGPVLVHRHAVATHLPRAATPLSPGAVLEWTARVLRSHAGYLVPESESEGLDTRRDPMLEPSTAARLLLGRAVVTHERVALLLELFERAGRRSVRR